MDNIINFNEKVAKLCLSNIDSLLESQGIVGSPNGQYFVLQGNPLSETLKNLRDKVIDLNKYLFRVDSNLIREGWYPVPLVLRIDENYFINRKTALEFLKWPILKEEKSFMLEDNAPVVAFYGKYKGDIVIRI